jgi:hypothetical protein
MAWKFETPYFYWIQMAQSVTFTSMRRKAPSFKAGIKGATAIAVSGSYFVVGCS